MTKKLKVMLYCDWHLAATYLQPVFEYLTQNHGDKYEVFFSGSVPESTAFLGHIPGATIRPRLEPFDVVLCCDSLSTAPARDGRRLVLFHGLASKAQDFCSTRRGQCDFGYYISPSDFYTERLITLQGISRARIVGTGLSKFDRCVRSATPPRRDRPLVAYMPTHNGDLSGIPVLKDSIYQVGGVRVHLHGYTAYSQEKPHVEARQHYDVEEQMRVARLDNVGLLRDCDVLIADFGSTVVEGLALGKYVLQVINPRAKDFLQRNADAVGDDWEQFPEVAFPKKYGYAVRSIDDIHRFLAGIGNAPVPRIPEIVANIGKYAVSKQVERFLRGRL